jgi:hypothetical protein
VIPDVRERARGSERERSRESRHEVERGVQGGDAGLESGVALVRRVALDKNVMLRYEVWRS